MSVNNCLVYRSLICDTARVYIWLVVWSIRQLPVTMTKQGKTQTVVKIDQPRNLPLICSWVVCIGLAEAV
jgi:hypothetical protein